MPDTHAWMRPCEQVVTRKKKGRTDHSSNVNYDDLNEFFWTPSCLM